MVERRQFMYVGHIDTSEVTPVILSCPKLDEAETGLQAGGAHLSTKSFRLMNQRDGYDAHTAAGDALPTRAAPSRTSSASSSSPVSTLIRDGARRRRSSSISKAGSNSSSSVVEAAVFPAGNSHAVDTFAGASQSRHQRSMRQNDASSNSASGGSSEKNSFSQAEAMQRTNSAGSYSDGGLSDESENVLAPSSRSPSASGSKTTAKRPKLSRAERDRLKTKRFAREMTFVVRISIANQEHMSDALRRLYILDCPEYTPLYGWISHGGRSTSQNESERS